MMLGRKMMASEMTLNTMAIGIINNSDKNMVISFC